MTEHSAITDPYVHEPKDVSSADEDTAYFSTGAGTGSWLKIYTMGHETIADSGTPQALADTAWTDLTNDGLGTGSGSDFILPGWTSLWNTTDNEFDFASAGVSVGDTVDLRFDYTVTVSSNNDLVTLSLDMAHGSTSEYKFIIDSRNVDLAGDEDISRFVSVPLCTADCVNFPAKLSMYADSAGDTVTIDKVYYRVIPRNPVVA